MTDAKKTSHSDGNPHRRRTAGGEIERLSIEEMHAQAWDGARKQDHRPVSSGFKADEGGKPVSGVRHSGAKAAHDCGGAWSIAQGHPPLGFYRGKAILRVIHRNLHMSLKAPSRSMGRTFRFFFVFCGPADGPNAAIFARFHFGFHCAIRSPIGVGRGLRSFAGPGFPKWSKAIIGCWPGLFCARAGDCVVSALEPKRRPKITSPGPFVDSWTIFLRTTGFVVLSAGGPQTPW